MAGLEQGSNPQEPQELPILPEDGQKMLGLLRQSADTGANFSVLIDCGVPYYLISDTVVRPDDPKNPKEFTQDHKVCKIPVGLLNNGLRRMQPGHTLVICGEILYKNTQEKWGIDNDEPEEPKISMHEARDATTFVLSLSHDGNKATLIVIRGEGEDEVEYARIERTEPERRIPVQP